MVKKTVYIFAFLFFCHANTYSQKNGYQFMHLDVRQGLSHNQVNTVFKDEKGFIWFGTLSGLNRFDGYDFKIFRNDLYDSTTLSDNYIAGIYELPDRKLWIVTRNGNNIYDPVTESFSRNDQRYLASLSLPTGNVTFISKDKKGNFWFVYQGLTGLYKYSHETGRAEKISVSQDNIPGIPPADISMLTHDRDNNTWIMYRNGFIEKLDFDTGKTGFSTGALQKRNGGRNENYFLFLDDDNELWITVPLSVTQGGVYYYTPETGMLNYFSKETGRTRLNSNIIAGIIQSADGKIWIGTDHGGINILDKKTMQVQYLLNDAEDHTSISQNSVWCVYKDDKDVIWVGTFKQGINYYSSQLALFSLYKHKMSDLNSLPFEDINKFVEDKNGNLWIGTNGGGLLYFDRSREKFTRFRHNPSDPNSISSDVVVSLCMDHENKLWIGTYFGGLNCYDGKRFRHYRHNVADTGSISDDSVWEIFEDSDHRLWIGTLTSGLNLFDRATQTFRHFDVENGMLHSNYITSIIEDQQKNLWLATSNGVDVLHQNLETTLSYSHDDKDPASLSNNNVMSLLQDGRGRIWVGTREGLNLFDAEKKTFTVFRKEDGLPDNTILTLLEDEAHNLWMGTPNGLSNGIVSAGDKREIRVRFVNYDESNGLQGREFNDKAAHKLHTGELAFGGPYGFNIFFPDRFSSGREFPKIVLTGLQVFNQTVKPLKKINGYQILPEAISETGEITLKYNHNVFSLSFAALGAGMSTKNKFRYMLEGFNKEWLTTDGSRRTITYTNLDPGHYTLRIRSDSDDPSAMTNAATLGIRILPPFWRTIPAFALYILALTGILFLARRFIIQRAHIRFQMEQQQKEANRIHELDMMKLKFFTNVSHEFRTPISLILSPVEKLLKESDDRGQKKQYQLIYRNAKRLLALVNQLLDFRKLEMKELRLQLSMGNIVSFLKDITLSFTDLAERKNIIFSFSSSVEALDMRFDADKVERILFNLLSNAFKFTRENGKIGVQVRLAEENPENKMLEIRVSDTGIGIPGETKEKIFERYFQHEVPGNMLNRGSGIGLAISKEFARLHGGDIRVDSMIGEGTTFTVQLPLTAPFTSVSQKTGTEAEVTPLMLAAPGETASQSAHRKSILVVEDNDDIRFYIQDNLRNNYTVFQAVNGTEGWKMAQELQPDLIVSDVMMPEMDGIALLHKIKTNTATSHIPVILLTALVTDEQKLEGLDAGAVDYITKPFSFEMLQSRIRALLSQQESMRRLFQKQIEINPKEISATPVDEKFISEAVEIVEKNISEAEFSVEDLSKALFMSRVALYKKLLALTGKSPLDFIRVIRMKRAAQLMEKTRMAVSEIAYEVGFNNPKYFTKQFKKEYDLLPSEYIAKNRNRNLSEI
ncbi:MAG: response regulator [Chitinophagaceae bacterium]|nr:response regulator [Chitinophagaceae bacterium]